MVFQHFNLFPHMTVLENCVLAPMLVRKVDRKTAEAQALAYLEKVKIPSKALAYPGQLAGNNSASRLRERCVWPLRSCCLMNRHRPLIPR